MQHIYFLLFFYFLQKSTHAYLSMFRWPVGFSCPLESVRLLYTCPLYAYLSKISAVAFISSVSSYYARWLLQTIWLKDVHFFYSLLYYTQMHQHRTASSATTTAASYKERNDNEDNNNKTAQMLLSFPPFFQVIIITLVPCFV